MNSTTLSDPSKDLSAASPSASPAATPRFNVLGIPFDALNLEGAVNRIERFIAARTPRQIFFANAYTVAQCWKDRGLRQVVEHSDLVLADGMSIVWGARWIRLRLPGRVAGPDLTQSLCERAAACQHRVFLLGSTPENLEALRRRLLHRWPALLITGVFSPSMCERISEAENAEILRLVHAARPDILLVGMSAPKQEKWIARNLAALQVPVCLGIGAAFDFLSGRVARAPQWMRRSGLEWLYRLAREPRRLWRRYLLGNLIFLSHLAAAWVRSRLHPKPVAH